MDQISLINHINQRGIQDIILCTISLAISYVSHLFVLIFVQKRTILIAEQDLRQMKPPIYVILFPNETTNLQTPSFK